MGFWHGKDACFSRCLRSMYLAGNQWLFNSAVSPQTADREENVLFRLATGLSGGRVTFLFAIIVLDFFYWVFYRICTCIWFATDCILSPLCSL